jgi:hypothetical protein
MESTESLAGEAADALGGSGQRQAVRTAWMEAPMTAVTMAVRRGVALLLCAALFLQACATVSPAPEGAVLGRSVIERGIELKADVGTVPHSAEAQYVMRLREGRVIPLILVIGNVDASDVVQVSQRRHCPGADRWPHPSGDQGVPRGRARADTGRAGPRESARRPRDVARPS